MADNRPEHETRGSPAGYPSFCFAGPVSRVLSPERTPGLCHLSTTAVTCRLKQPTPDIGRAILDCRYTRSCNPRDVRPDDIAASAVGSYPAFSPLPAVRSRRPAASHGSRRVPNLPPAGGHSLLRSHNLTAVKSLACVALCVARTFLPPACAGGDRADLRCKDTKNFPRSPGLR